MKMSDEDAFDVKISALFFYSLLKTLILECYDNAITLKPHSLTHASADDTEEKHFRVF